MTDFPFHTIESADEPSKSLLEKAEKNFGFIPNLLAGMAESPALLEGYMRLSTIFDKTEFGPIERQIIMLTVSRQNGCAYCMAAHTSGAQMAKVPDDVIESLRLGTAIADPKWEALRTFTQKVVESRGWPDENDLQALFAAGYTKRTALEVVLGVGLKTLSNYTNHLTQTPVDPVFEKNAWKG